VPRNGYAVTNLEPRLPHCLRHVEARHDAERPAGLCEIPGRWGTVPSCGRGVVNCQHV